MDLDCLNKADPDTFTKQLDGIFEHSPWIARKAADKRPFSSIEELYQAMVSVVQEASPEEKNKLIEAHPRLGGSGKMTAESRREQEGAGLRRLKGGEADSFTRLNLEYEKRFDFPFIMAVRGLTKQEIYAAMKERISRSKAQESKTAINEICKIARFRLEDKFSSESDQTENDAG
ncbi:2-oxo-4-hydroxy-4-carboxy-5-ureidoimidazoline decarboxylase [Sporolactobacillus sp. THM7-4]|nr:2-oxo-4-hydroxy-4-carboxy-5-ureidoimidazoline decarboxylase [Sporolactobacillus sp. THM7-4]